MTDVFLVTCADLPLGEEGGDLLVEALAERTLSAQWVVWDDASVDWSTPRMVAVRSTWDYHHRLGEFLAWAEHVARWSRLMHGVDVFRWNTDKAYLLELEGLGLPVVPTALLDDPADLGEVAAGFEGRVLVKPRIGAGGSGLVVIDKDALVADLLAETGWGLSGGPWVVQPVVESVRTEGECSVFVLDGLPVSQVQKHPVGSEVRVQEQYGGASVAVPMEAEAATLAVTAVAAAEDLVGCELQYARVDALRLDDGRLVVSEIEVTEPGLYLDVVPKNAVRFARMIDEFLYAVDADHT